MFLLSLYISFFPRSQARPLYCCFRSLSLSCPDRAVERGVLNFCCYIFHFYLARQPIDETAVI
jgi:hypothetical protein